MVQHMASRDLVVRGGGKGGGQKRDDGRSAAKAVFASHSHHQIMLNLVSFQASPQLFTNTLTHTPLVPLQVALTAVSSALALTATIMDDQQALEQHAAATKPKAGLPNLMALQLQEPQAAAPEMGEGGEEAEGEPGWQGEACCRHRICVRPFSSLCDNSPVCVTSLSPICMTFLPFV